MSDGDLISAIGIKKLFRMDGRELFALDDVSLTVKDGETLGLVGESGSGKTTFGRTLIGIYSPTVGEIFFRGKRIASPDDMKEYRRSCSMVFQDPYSSLDPRMTVLDIIAEPIDIQGLYFDKKERTERVLHLMDRVGLAREHISRYPHEFSGGQRQRIGIARALSTAPEFLVLDEPVSALDVSIQAQIINMLERLSDELHLTSLFIAHDLLVVRHISDRIAVMYLGRIVEIADADSLCERPLHPYTMALISAVPIPDPAIARKRERIILGSDIPSPVDVPSGCAFRTRCPYKEKICELQRPELTEIETGRFVACHRVHEIHN